MSQQFEDEIKTMSKKSSELKSKVESLQNEICEKQVRSFQTTNFVTIQVLHIDKGDRD